MKRFITAPKSIAPLSVFRVLFGFVMLVSIIRFAANGWIYELYLQPGFFFSYYGFEWVTPPGEYGIYVLFFVMGMAALCIMLGYYYRLAAAVFFLAFTYVELIDKTNYLNHYYFVSIIGFLLMLVPAHRRFSLDVLRKPEWRVSKVPAWTINIFKLQIGLVYFFAGLAKLNPEWLFNAMPLQLWLPANAHLPLIGPLLEYSATAYLFSWAGAIYDLGIVFFLLYKPTRAYAYAAVVLFHLVTFALFQIGMFPFIMILCTLIFFSEEFHESAIEKVNRGWEKVSSLVGIGSISMNNIASGAYYSPGKKSSGILAAVLAAHFALQILLPFRYALYPGNLFWTEQGYRFSWRVMLMEKAGYAIFHVHDHDTGRSWEVSNWEYLTPQQEKMMATQPDMIQQFAHHLEQVYSRQGIDNVAITAEAYVTLNGRRSSLMVDPEVDLTETKRGFSNKEWIMPYPADQKHWLSSYNR